MIRTLTVCTGESDLARAAQAHAIDLARAFSARLRALHVHTPAQAEEIERANPDVSAEELARHAFKDVLDQAAAAGIEAEGDYRGEGIPYSLIAESRETDLIVLGAPTYAETKGRPSEEEALEIGRAVLRKAESALYVVDRPPSPIKKVLVAYQGGTEGKAALRLAGHFAEAVQAVLDVISADGDMARAQMRASAAEQYLRGFQLPEVSSFEAIGRPAADTDLIETADRMEADVLVFGDEPYGFLDRFFGDAESEEVALATERPVLIAR